MIWQTVLVAMLPEHLLLTGIVGLLVLEIGEPRSRGAVVLALGATVAAALVALWLWSTAYSGAPFPGHYAVGPATSLAKFLLLALAVPVLVLSREEFTSPRYYALMLGSLYGACLMPSSMSFLTLFLGIELLSLPVYVLVLLAFQRPEGAEACACNGAVRRHSRVLRHRPAWRTDRSPT